MSRRQSLVCFSPPWSNRRLTTALNPDGGNEDESMPRWEGFVRTRRQALPKLLGLVGVLQDEGVEVLRASDLELGLGLATR